MHTRASRNGGIRKARGGNDLNDVRFRGSADRQHGEALRLIDMPATFDDLDHVFDRLPADLETCECLRAEPWEGI
jgi:hypothetical protein